MTAPFQLEALESRHDRSTFASGEPQLDLYFKTQVTQDIRRRIANCFVAIEVANSQIAAYYTIASASIHTAELPSDIAKRLPRYPTMPAVRIGSLAVNIHHQGRGLGKAMLADAALKAMNAAPASYALLVDAKDQQAGNFYKHHGFMQLGSLANILYLPLATAEKLLLNSKT